MQRFSHWSSANSSVVSNLHGLKGSEMNCLQISPEVKDFKQTFFPHKTVLSTKRHVTDWISVYSSYPFNSIFLKAFVKEVSCIPLFYYIF